MSTRRNCDDVTGNRRPATFTHTHTHTRTHTLKKNSLGNSKMIRRGGDIRARTHELLTHGNDWYQQGTVQLLWRYVKCVKCLNCDGAVWKTQCNGTNTRMWCFNITAGKYKINTLLSLAFYQSSYLQHPINLTFWSRNYFFKILAHTVYKMWIIQEPNTLELWNKLHFEEGKNGEYIPCLKYSVHIFVE